MTNSNSPYSDLNEKEVPSQRPKCTGPGSDPAWFHPNSQREYQAALTICRGCPLANMCRSQGEGNGETGVWGGVLLRNGNVINSPRFQGDRAKRPKDSDKAEEIQLVSVAS